MTIEKQKSLSDWLIVSDIDGTLNNKFRRLPKRNFEAINRFVTDLGGHFTLASGRSVESLEKHFKKLPIENTPAVVLNGAGIYDFSKREMISFSPIGADGRELVQDIFDRFPLIEINICTIDMIYLVRPRIFGPAIVLADKLPHRRCKTPSEVPPERWGKVIFLGLPPVVKKVVEYTKTLEPLALDINLMSSSVSSYELLAGGVHKGTAVLKVADILGIGHDKTGAIGDYFNDYDMLKSVALPAVCGQAPAEMKKIAKFVACHCNEGAVGDFLEYVEKNYANY